jgi:Flp pilus assembly protein TadD
MMRRKLGRFQEALDAFLVAGKLAPANPLVAESVGDVLYDLGKFREAENEYRRARKMGRALPGLESKLGLSQIRNGRSDEGLRRLHRAVALDSRCAELHDRLIAACVWLNQPQEAAKAADHKLIQVVPTETDFLRAASIYAQLPDMARVAEILTSGLAQFPQSPRLRAALAEVHSVSAGL